MRKRFFNSTKTLISTLFLYIFICGSCATGATPKEITTLKAKAAIAEQQLKIALENKKNVSKVVPKMQQVKVLADNGKIKLADTLLNEVLLDFKKLNTTEPASYSELIVNDEYAINGVYDPSIEYGKDGIGWMSYSSVESGNISNVHTRIARSDDQGRSWKHVLNLNNATKDIITLADGEIINGKWWNEVSSLVHDPNDTGKEWKLFWHKYFTRVPHSSSEDRVLSHSWIAYRTASSPDGPWSNEIALFGAGPFPLAPYNTQFNITDLHQDLKPYIVLTEPGSLYFEGKIFLSLQAFQNPKFGKNKHDTILIMSDDHGTSWKHVSIVLKAEEAQAFDADIFTGSSLVLDNGRVFLLICPSKIGEKFAKSGHRGTLIFEFENIHQGKLKRNTDNSLYVVKYLAPQLSKGGQSDYDVQNINGGIVMPQFDMKNLPKAFRIYNTHQTIISH